VIFGMTASTYTFLHVLISLVGIGSGLIVMFGLLTGKRVDGLTALYLNVFVLIVQAFLKVPLLNALAPTQTEPPFLITQVVILALFVVLTVLAVWAATSLTRSATHTGSKIGV
jgi:hypothetical protein